MKLLAPLRRYKTLSIMPTWQCTAACEHCGTGSSPKERTRLDFERVLLAIDQAAEDPLYKVVVFTGGEPTLAGKNLLRGILRAKSHGLTVRIVTNAHWAKTDAAADRQLGELVGAGLDEINYSTGDQHARFVPLDNIIRATGAALKKSLRTIAIMVETTREREITKSTILSRSDFKELTQRFPNGRVRINESPWMPLSPEVIGDYPEGRAANNGNLLARRGCKSILTTTTVQANGEIGACCGLGMRYIPELQIGHVNNTTIADADEMAAGDFLKRWIRQEGPERILEWAASYDSSIKWEGMYAHHCQACIRLYKDSKVRAVIAEHWEDKLADVLFNEWLLHHYDPIAAASSNQSVFTETSARE